MIMPGGKPTMYMSIIMFGEPGVEIMYPDPGFPIYRSMIEFTGATPVPIPIREGYGFAFSAEETLSLFATYLGRIAGDMACTFMARGGVYLAGGIPQKILPALQRPEFRAAFEDKAPHTEMMKTIPTHVVTHPLAALSGLAAYARKPASFGLATEGRRWRK